MNNENHNLSSAEFDREAPVRKRLEAHKGRRVRIDIYLATLASRRLLLSRLCRFQLPQLGGPLTPTA